MSGRDFATPASTESDLRRIAGKLEAKGDALEGFLVQAAEAKHQAKLAHAKAYLMATGPVEERKAKAFESTAELALAGDIAEAVADACREGVRSLRDQLSAMQSLHATARAASGLVNR